MTAVNALAVALLLRAAGHAEFAIWAASQRPGWTRLFETGAIFGFVDGAIGLLSAVLLVRFAPIAAAPPLLSQLTFADAAGRLATALVVHVFPGIPVVLVATAPLFGAVGAAVAGLGVLAITMWAIARVRAGRTWRLDTDAVFDPIAIAAVLSFGAGYKLIVSPPGTVTALRSFAIAVSVALAFVFSVASIGAFVRGARDASTEEPLDYAYRAVSWRSQQTTTPHPM